MVPEIDALILTKNEDIHIERCLKSIQNLVSNIYVIDSGSTDNTRIICEKYKVKFIVNPFISHPQQFNYGLEILRNNNSQWVLKIDADEFFTNKLIQEVKKELAQNNKLFAGYAIKRKIIFNEKVLNFGGVTTTQLRIFQTSLGFCEDVFMDEHIKVKGKVKILKESFFDYSLKGISWWTEKHNIYSTKEVINSYVLNNDLNNSNNFKILFKNRIKRLFKTKIYSKIPLLIRPFFYFLFKYIFLLGFLDGKEGLIYNFLQVLWYRFLVDVKASELKKYAIKNGLTLRESVKPFFDIDL